MTCDQPLISVVIPLLNEQDVVGRTLDELTRVLSSLEESYEITVVDDGSGDETFNEIKRFNDRNPRIKGIRLSRHFGKEAAVLAGLSHAAGRAVVTMDGDLQHPPSLIPEMLLKWKEGAEIVHGVKSSRNETNLGRFSNSRVFNSLFSHAAGFNILNSSDFKLFDTHIAQLLVRKFPEQQRFHRGLSNWVGFRQEQLVFKVQNRTAGESRWPLRRLFSYGWNALTSFTSLPLQIVPLLGLIMLTVSLLLGSEALISKLLGNSVSGFATLEITILFSSSIIMIGLGIIGQYLARIYDETKNRPVYLVGDTVGFESEPTLAGREQSRTCISQQI